jgi:putative peptide zinc metalloprotease protein
MLPFLRLDGYYVVSDLVGVPDLFRRIGPVLRSAVPFRPLEPEVQALKPWVRRVIAGWVLVLVPVLGLNLGYFVLSAPRIAATAWDSAMRFLGQVPAGGLDGTIAAVQLLLLLLPAVGLTYTTLRLGRRAAASAWRWSDGSPARRLAATVGAAALLGVLTVAWFPDARLTPYREGERGTVQQSVRELSAFRSGAPLLRSPQQAQDRLPSIPSGRSAVLEAVPAPRGAPAADEPVATPTGPLTPTATSAPPSPADDSPATEVGATPRPAPDGPTASPQAPSGAASPQTTTGPDGSVRATTSPTPTGTTSPAPDAAGPAPTPSGTTPTSPTDVTATPSSNG